MTASMQRTSVLAALTLAAACRPDANTKPPRTGTTESPRRTQPDLESLADIVEGRNATAPSLQDGMPAWVTEAFAIGSLPPDVGEMRSAIGAWRSLANDAAITTRLAVAARLGRLAIAVERAGDAALADPELLLSLTQLYATLDVPQLLDPRGLFGSLITAAATSFARQTQEEQRAAELYAWLPAALGRVPALHRHMLARVMRQHVAGNAATDAEVAELLEGLAALEPPEQGNPVRLRRAALELRGDDAPATSHRELASACFVALDLPCGDAELAIAQRMTPSPDAKAVTRTKEIEAERALAVRALELATQRGFDDRMTRAKLAVSLGRVREGAEMFAALRRDHPDDARLLAGQIDAQLRVDYDFQRAYQTLAAAPAELQHRDAASLELFAGVRCVHIFYAVLPASRGASIDAMVAAALPTLVPLRRDVAELAALGVEKGVVLEFALALGDELLPLLQRGDQAGMIAIARGLLPRVVELRKRVPQSVHAYDLMLAAVQFSTDTAAVEAALAAPLPAGADDKLRLRSVMTRLVIAVALDRRDAVAPLVAEIKAWPAETPGATRALALARAEAVNARLLGTLEALANAIERQQQALPEQPQAEHVTDLCNVATLLLDAGEPATANEVLAMAQQLAPDDAFVLLIRAVAAGDRNALELLSSNGESQVAIAASSWLERTETNAAKRKQWVQRRKQAERSNPLRARVLPTELGVGASAELNLGVGYSTSRGLELQLAAAPTPRVLPRPPAAAKPTRDAAAKRR